MQRLLPLIVLIALATVPATANAADPFTTQNIKVVANIGPASDMPCTVDATLYKPNTATADSPAPAILATNGFGNSKTEFATLGPSYARRGYVFLAYSGLGFGASDCKIELDDPDYDGKAASAMIDFLGGGRKSKEGVVVDYVKHDATDHAGNQQAHDPRVGMIGGSYGGEVQFAAADVDKRLDTIVPQITWNDLAYSLAPNNTAFKRGVTYDDKAPGIEKYQWVSVFFAIGVAGTGTGSQNSGNQSHLGPCPNFDDRACQSKAQMDAQGYPSQATLDMARHASVTSYMSQIKIPTFLAQGQADTLFNLNEATATYNALRAQGTPTKMLWRSAGHSGGGLGTSESNEATPEASYASRAYLEWFDYYLGGVGDAPALDFSFYRDWVKFPDGKDAAPSVQTVPAYPAAGDQSWFLSGSADLVSSAAAVKSGSQAFQFSPGAATSYSETSEFDQSQPTRDGPGTFAAYTSPALGQDTDVVGIPRLTFSLSAPLHEQSQAADPGGMLMLFVKLYDVTPAGDVLAHRLIAPIRIPDATKPISLTLPGIVHRFAKGDKFKLVIAASDAAYKNNNAPDQVTITVDPKKPFELSIPVLGTTLPGSAPATQEPGAGVQKQVLTEGSSNSAANLPKAKGCTGKRKLRFRLRRTKRTDRALSATISINGKRVKTLRGKALKRPVVLRIPRKRTARVVVTIRTKKHHTLRSARTYNRTCH